MSQAPPPPPPPPPPGGVPGVPPSAPAPPPEGNPLVGYWKRVVLERYAQFDGRASRAEFWWFYLANIIVAVVLYAVAAILGQVSSVFAVLAILLLTVYWLGLIVPSLAVAVRRLHDTDKSGWFLLLYLIPCAGPIIILVFMVTEGTRGPNQFGAAAS